MRELHNRLQPLGGTTLSDPKGRLLIADGQSSIAFMSIAFESGSHIPHRLFHRVITTDSVGEGAIIATHHAELHVLGPPVEGANWLAADGPSNDQENHNRRGVVILDGRGGLTTLRDRLETDQRRCVIFWRRAGCALLLFYSYGKPVLAVADGRVVAARGGLPENVPGRGDAFHAAVPITLETVAGNTITLDLGSGTLELHIRELPLNNSVVVFGEDRPK